MNAEKGPMPETDSDDHEVEINSQVSERKISRPIAKTSAEKAASAAELTQLSMGDEDSE